MTSTITGNTIADGIVTSMGNCNEVFKPISSIFK
eukprot:CAMPEP_0195301304 /NCGR_PEP_ID=MMETSP0707-20130614/29073_1 /TAXON_ID=33640 /ORGANISM="Asterionellopsis glacialis, Strain CCMP134" /LENGTH=33 /DNA_ID= /DNA_START= /DNA_END= /DNA_ORIENTATION=